jgi:CMP-N-acetylneuraminic acid synthetase
LAGDCIGDLEVPTHALHATVKLDGRTYDIIVMLQPTSPFRKPEQVSACIRMLVEGNWDAVWTVSPTDSKRHPFKQLNGCEEGALDLYDSAGAQIIARQQLEPVYHRNGIAYAFTRECLMEQKTIRLPITARPSGFLVSLTPQLFSTKGRTSVSIYSA